MNKVLCAKVNECDKTCRTGGMCRHCVPHDKTAECNGMCYKIFDEHGCTNQPPEDTYPKAAVECVPVKDEEVDL